MAGAPVGSGVPAELGSGVGAVSDGSGVGVTRASGDGDGAALLGGALLGVVGTADDWLAGLLVLSVLLPVCDFG